MKSAETQDRARQGSGEPPMTDGDLRDIRTALAALETRTTQELRSEWRKLYRAEPPRRLSRDLVLRAIAYRIQERTHGGLGLATKRRLNALAEELKTKGASHFDGAAVLKPGTKLVREWHGSSAIWRRGRSCTDPTSASFFGSPISPPTSPPRSSTGISRPGSPRHS